MHKSVKLSNLINDCVVMAQQAGKIIRNTHYKKDSTGFWASKEQLAKVFRSVVDKQQQASLSAGAATQQVVEGKDAIEAADLLIRKTYMHNLSQLYPGLKLVVQGERPNNTPFYANQAFIQPDELLEYQKNPALTIETLSRNALNRKSQTAWYNNALESVFAEEAASLGINPGELQNEYKTADIAVWIDPIDGTKALLNGDIENVTNLIGITVNGRPKVGILHKPFSKDRPNMTRTYVGSVEAGLFYMDYSTASKRSSSATYVPPFEQKGAELAAGHYQPHILMGTCQTNQNMMQSVVSDLQPMQVNRVKGPGNKFLHLTDERSDFFLNLVPGYDLWDICAPEAIFASRFGILTDAKQKPIFYDSTPRRSFSLWNGIVAARNPDIYFATKKSYERRSGKTLAVAQTQIRRDMHMQKVQRSRADSATL